MVCFHTTITLLYTNVTLRHTIVTLSRSILDFFPVAGLGEACRILPSFLGWVELIAKGGVHGGWGSLLMSFIYSIVKILYNKSELYTVPLHLLFCLKSALTYLSGFNSPAIVLRC